MTNDQRIPMKFVYEITSNFELSDNFPKELIPEIRASLETKGRTVDYDISLLLDSYSIRCKHGRTHSSEEKPCQTPLCSHVPTDIINKLKEKEKLKEYNDDKISLLNLIVLGLKLDCGFCQGECGYPGCQGGFSSKQRGKHGSRIHTLECLEKLIKEKRRNIKLDALLSLNKEAVTDGKRVLDFLAHTFTFS